jgi:hypothetical protein
MLTMALAAITLVVAAQERLKSEGEMPIVAWVGIPSGLVNMERCLEMKEAGINTTLSFGYQNVADLEKGLEVAHKAGVKILAFCPDMEKPESIKRLMKYPALAGYLLKDEPNVTEFPSLAERVKAIQAIDSKHYCYINLFPNYVAPHGIGFDTESMHGKNLYKEYLEEYIKQIPVPFISFDNYPVKSHDGVRTIRGNWYENLEIIAEASRKSGLPMWAFALSGSHGQYPIPTIPELRLQMYSNLAYGAQGLQYFTYWSDGSFHHALIDAVGRRTYVYDRVKFVNSEIQSLACVFLGAKPVSVWHTGEQIPGGTNRLVYLPAHVKVFDTGESGAVVSLLEKGNRQFFVIVNRSLKDMMRLTALFDDTVKRVLKDGTLVPANKYSPVAEVEPGDIMIYTWEK